MDILYIIMIKNKLEIVSCLVAFSLNFVGENNFLRE